MDIKRKNLSDAAKDGIISSQQAESLYDYLAAQSPDISKFTFTHILYYMGGLLAIGAMTLFMNLGWESFGGAGILGISILYAIVGFMLTNSFAARKHPVPAGICATFVVCGFVGVIRGAL